MSDGYNPPFEHYEGKPKPMTPEREAEIRMRLTEGTKTEPHRPAHHYQECEACGEVQAAQMWLCENANEYLMELLAELDRVRLELKAKRKVWSAAASAVDKLLVKWQKIFELENKNDQTRTS